MCPIVLLGRLPKASKLPGCLCLAVKKVVVRVLQGRCPERQRLFHQDQRFARDGCEKSGKEKWNELRDWSAERKPPVGIV